MDEKNTVRTNYVTYPASLPGWRWYQPLLTGLVFILLYTLAGTGVMLLALVMADPENVRDLFAMLQGGYDAFDLFQVPGILISIGVIAVMLPMLMLSVKITRERPFFTLGSSKGGFRFGVFFRSLIPAVIALSPALIQTFTSERIPGTHPSLVCFLLIAILGPIQCIAEEYLFRGFIMQTVGGWTRLWPLAVLLQAVLFSAMHSYDLTGVTAIAALALTFGFSAWYTNGIEASSALHTCNNLLGFYAVQYGFGELSSDIDWESAIYSIAACVIYIVLVILLQKKFRWFDAEKKRRPRA